jgi:hypothetical protein
MDQQWEPVVLRKTAISTPVQRSVKKESDVIVKKQVQPESLQALMKRRNELKLTQKDADARCAFPVHTFRDIESKSAIPTEKQQNVIQRVLNIQLKIDKL